MATQQLEGFDELARQLRELPEAVAGKNLRSATMQTTTPVLKQIKDNAPVGTVRHKTYRGNWVDPGFSRDSLRRVSLLSPDKRKVAVFIGVRKEAYYSLQYVEMGVPKYGVAPRPFMEPVFNAYQNRMIDRLGDRLKKKIEQAAGSS